ncbi:MAG TPA: nucleotidyltransferase domain-containing protein [Anaerolineaceae bacterium]|nr:nucleotidyltransferase domain-containing protein [Anaerolineaceae bacterium]
MVLRKIEYSQKDLEKFCQRWKIIRLEIFGSAIRDDFNEESDIDLLVEYHPDFHRTLVDMEEMQKEIEEIFNRPVDLITRNSIERSQNPYKRQNILGQAIVIYG